MLHLRACNYVSKSCVGLGILFELTGASFGPPLHLHDCFSRVDITRFRQCMACDLFSTAFLPLPLHLCAIGDVPQRRFGLEILDFHNIIDASFCPPLHLNAYIFRVEVIRFS